LEQGIEGPRSDPLSGRSVDDGARRVQLFVRDHELAVRRDRDGDWIQSHALASIASPDLYLKRFEPVGLGPRSVGFPGHVHEREPPCDRGSAVVES
jgi:hypothetical protein